MASSVSAKVETLSTETQRLVGVSTRMMDLLQGRTLSLDKAEEAHDIVYKAFQTNMAQIDQLKLELQKKMTVANQDQTLPIIQRVTKLETDLSEELTLTNDIVLTYYPTAKIPYGRACIGPRKAAHIDTQNLKILSILANASCMREIRGDGNCFLSAFATRLLERAGMRETLLAILLDTALPAELIENLVETLTSSEENLEAILKNNHMILPLVHFLRRLTADEMKASRDDFEPFFLADIEQVFHGSTEGKSYEQLIDAYVLKMGVDFSHPMITALCRKLDFPIQIIDPNIGAAGGLNILGRDEAKGTFCRNGSHYFVLYSLEESPRIARSTEITVKFDTGLGNQLFIRGSGPGLSWERGIPLRNVGNDLWVFQTEGDFEQFEYKILLNDKQWEEGENRTAQIGEEIEILAKFPNQ